MVQGLCGEMMFKQVWKYARLYFYFSKNYFLNAIRSTESNGKSIAIDFDGVLAHYIPGMASRDEQGLPIQHARKVLKQLKLCGYNIIIWTSRPITRSLKSWFHDYDIPCDKIIQKPDCSLFIDDRAISFQGDWNETLQEIEQFKEWWR